MAASSSIAYRFGEFRLVPADQMLWRDGERVHLTPKAFRVLCELVQAQGRLVSRAELFDRHWRGAVVTDDALTRCLHELRRALGDEARGSRFIVTEQRRGVRFAMPVSPEDDDRAMTAAVDVPPPAPAEVTGGHFIGRAAALQAATLRLRALASGTHNAPASMGFVLEISGEAGIGKSRLVEHIAAQARNLGIDARLARVHAMHGDSWVWTQLLRLELGQGSAVSGIERLRSEAGTAAPHLRDVRADYAAARNALADVVANELMRASAAAPLLLALEDLHDASDDTLQTLLLIAARCVPARIGFVVTWRDVGVVQDATRVEVLARLRGLPCDHVALPLRGFDVGETTAWLEQNVPSDAPAALRNAAALCARTGGNPLFLTQLAELHAHGLLRDDTIDALGPHASIAEVLQRRLDAHTESTLQVLRLAAAIGDRFEPWMLGAENARSPAVVHRALSSAAADRLLQREADGAWRFSHGLVREALVALQSVEARWALARDAALALEQARARGGVDVGAARIAAHWLAAEPTPANQQRAIDALRAAQDEAWRECAFSDAATHARQLLKLLLSDPQATPAELGTQMLRCALADAQNGDPVRGRQQALAALDHARRAGDGRLVAHCTSCICELTSSYPVDERLPSLIGAALDGLDGDANAERAELLARRSAQHALAGAPREQLADAERAAAIARAAGDDAALEIALSALSPALNAAREHARWTAVTHERIALARRHNDRLAEFYARRQRLEQLLQGAEYAALAAELERWRAVALALGTPSARAAVARTDAGLALARGELAQAAEYAQRALELGHASFDASVAMALATVQFGALLLLQGRLGEVAERLRADAARVAQSSMFIAADLYVVAQSDITDVAMARERLRELAHDRFRALPNDVARPAALCFLAVAAERLAAVDAARVLAELLQPWAGSCVTITSYFTCGAADAYLGRLSHVVGNAEAADAHFARALAQEQRAGFTTWVAATHAARGRALRGRGKLAAATECDEAAAALARRSGFVVLP